MSKLPEGREPLTKEWFIDRAKRMSSDDEWPMVDDFSDITPMSDEEMQRAKEKSASNYWYKCRSCGGPSAGLWCDFCLKEE